MQKLFPKIKFVFKTSLQSLIFFLSSKAKVENMSGDKSKFLIVFHNEPFHVTECTTALIYMYYPEK